MHMQGECISTHLYTFSSPLMSSSPMPSIADIPTVPDDTSPEHTNSDVIDPATSTKMGSITYNWEEGGYNLEWESRDNFNKWLTHKQATIGIKIQLSRTYYPKNSAHFIQRARYSVACTMELGEKNIMWKRQHVKGRSTASGSRVGTPVPSKSRCTPILTPYWGDIILITPTLSAKII